MCGISSRDAYEIRTCFAGQRPYTCVTCQLRTNYQPAVTDRKDAFTICLPCARVAAEAQARGRHEIVQFMCWFVQLLSCQPTMRYSKLSSYSVCRKIRHSPTSSSCMFTCKPSFCASNIGHTHQQPTILAKHISIFATWHEWPCGACFNLLQLHLVA